MKKWLTTRNSESHLSHEMFWKLAVGLDYKSMMTAYLAPAPSGSAMSAPVPSLKSLRREEGWLLLLDGPLWMRSNQTQMNRHMVNVLERHRANILPSRMFLRHRCFKAIKLGRWSLQEARIVIIAHKSLETAPLNLGVRRNIRLKGLVKTECHPVYQQTTADVYLHHHLYPRNHQIQWHQDGHGLCFQHYHVQH